MARKFKCISLKKMWWKETFGATFKHCVHHFKMRKFWTLYIWHSTIIIEITTRKNQFVHLVYGLVTSQGTTRVLKMVNVVLMHFRKSLVKIYNTFRWCRHFLHLLCSLFFVKKLIWFKISLKKMPILFNATVPWLLDQHHWYQIAKRRRCCWTNLSSIHR